jgi:hypothetical protein
LVLRHDAFFTLGFMGELGMTRWREAYSIKGRWLLRTKKQMMNKLFRNGYEHQKEACSIACPRRNCGKGLRNLP